MHYERSRHRSDLSDLGPAGKLIEHTRQSGLCQGPECDRPAIARGCCNSHYQQLRAGVPLAPLLKYGHDEPQGNGWINKEGYRILSIAGRDISEHKYLAQKLLGRELEPHENVHHVNGNRADNRTDGPFVLDERGRMRSGNLEIWSTSQPKGQEIGPKLAWAREIIALYGDLA